MLYSKPFLLPFLMTFCFVFSGLSLEATSEAAPSKKRVKAKGKKKKRARRRRRKRKSINMKKCSFKRSRGWRSKLCRKYTKKNKKNEIFVLIHGNRKHLYLCRGPRLLTAYPIGYGSRGLNKRKEGDYKTPVGTYRIGWMASRYEPYRVAKKEEALKRYQIRYKKAFCRIDLKTQISHFRRDFGPKMERLWRYEYGGRHATTILIDYPNAKDKKLGRTGSCIQIHAAYHLRASAGCVILWPHQMIELYQCLQPGSRIEIRAKL